MIKHNILVSTGADAAVYERFVELVRKGDYKEVQVLKTECLGITAPETVVKILPEGLYYIGVTLADVEEIVNATAAGKVVERLMAKGDNGKAINIPPYLTNIRIALKNVGYINPESLDEYIATRGYEALAHCLTAMTPEEVIAVVKASGLRGRGGAGFPTGLKWEFAFKNKGDKKYVICNADEGDPGAFMDRSLLEGDPHSTLEAMAICGYAIGADEGIIYCRAEYPLAVARIEKAIKDAKEMGLLGDDILGTGFNFNLSINLGAGAFVCGEETSLMNSIEGGRGEPRVKPPFPAEKGLWQAPSNINNVETFANVRHIILNGADWFASIGSEKSKGTKVFALAGKINNVGLIEVPMGTTLREIIYDVGGGVTDGKQFKAIQTGGPSGGCLPASHIDLPVDYDSLVEAGSMMGSGGLIVMDEDDCMVGIARFYLDFTVEESCGKCTPCRIGTRRMLEMLDDITEGKATTEYMDELHDLGEVIINSSLCGLGQTAPNPVISTMDYFKEEYLAHVKDHKCPAGQCTALLKYVVIPEKCTGCTICKRVCPVDCIAGERKELHIIDQSRCIKCGVCLDKCPFDAIKLD